MKAIAISALYIVAIGYPVIIYFGVNHLSPALFALGLAALALAKLLLERIRTDVRILIMLAVLALYGGFSALLNSEWLLRLYPVIVSFCMATIFFITVFDDESLIEMIAKRMGKVITLNAKRYTRKLTAIWAIVLVINGSIGLYLAMYATLKVWALYCGLISYLFFALLCVIEFLYRQYYIKKYGV